MTLRTIRRRNDRHQRIDAPHGQQDTQHAAHYREQQTLGQQLPRDSPTAGTQGRSQCNLTFARGGSSEQQIGDVGTRDQQHGRDRSDQHPQGAFQVATQLVVQRNDFGPGAEPGIRKLSSHTSRNSTDIGFGLSDGDAWFQPRDDKQVVSLAWIHARLSGSRRCSETAGSDPDFALGRELEARRHDADDGVSRARHEIIEHDRLANGVRVSTKPLLPEVVTDDDDGVRIFDVFFGLERSPQNWRYAQRLEETRRDIPPGNLLGRRVIAHQAEPPRHVRELPDEGHVGKDIVLLLPVRVELPVDRLAIVTVFRPAFPHRDQPVGFGKRQRLQHDRLEDTEDRRRRSDAQRKSQHGHDREAGTLSEHSQAEAKILPHGVDPSRFRV